MSEGRLSESQRLTLTLLSLGWLQLIYVPVTTDFGAFDESVQWGVKIHSPKTKDNWSAPYQFSFAIEDEKMKQEFVDAVVKTLKQDVRENTGMMKLWAEQFNWDKIANRWEEIIK
jgi:hypothetical protein